MKRMIYSIKYKKGLLPKLSRSLKGRGVAFFILTALVFLGWIPNNNDCISEVRDIYKSMKMDDLEKGNVYLNYTIITNYKPNGNQTRKSSKTNVEMIIAKEQMHYKTAEAIVFIDNKDNFTIIPDRKVIYWSDSMLELEKEKRIKTFAAMQDSLFKVSKLIDCKMKTNVAEGYDKIVTMQPLEKAKKTYPYKQFAVYINTKEKAIKKVVIDVLPQFEFTKIEMIYNKIELNYSKENLKDPVRNIVLTEANKVNDKYKGYKLIDTRLKGKKGL